MSESKEMPPGLELYRKLSDMVKDTGRIISRLTGLIKYIEFMSEDALEYLKTIVENKDLFICYIDRLAKFVEKLSKLDGRPTKETLDEFERTLSEKDERCGVIVYKDEKYAGASDALTVLSMILKEFERKKIKIKESRASVEARETINLDNIVEKAYSLLYNLEALKELLERAGEVYERAEAK